MNDKMSNEEEEKINKKLDLILDGFDKLDKSKYKALLGSIKILEASLDFFLTWIVNFEKDLEVMKPNLEKTLSKIGEVRAKASKVCIKLEVERQTKLN